MVWGLKVIIKDLAKWRYDEIISTQQSKIAQLTRVRFLNDEVEGSNLVRGPRSGKDKLICL